jgi:hypothetical protein
VIGYFFYLRPPVLPFPHPPRPSLPCFSQSFSSIFLLFAAVASRRIRTDVNLFSLSFLSIYSRLSAYIFAESKSVPDLHRLHFDASCCPSVPFSTIPCRSRYSTLTLRHALLARFHFFAEAFLNSYLSVRSLTTATFDPFRRPMCL